MFLGKTTKRALRRRKEIRLICHSILKYLQESETNIYLPDSNSHKEARKAYSLSELVEKLDKDLNDLRSAGYLLSDNGHVIFYTQGSVIDDYSFVLADKGHSALADNTYHFENAKDQAETIGLILPYWSLAISLIAILISILC